jgi:FkbM family methyltransferase
MKKLIRKIIGIPVINFVIRTIVKRYAISSKSLSATMMRYIQVSGKVNVSVSDRQFALWGAADDALVSKLYYNSGWEKEIVSWFSGFAGKYSTIIDAGANIGVFSLLAASINPGAVVHSFEPNPYNYERLKKNVALNKLHRIIQLHRLALGDREGNLTFYLPADNRISDVSSVYAAHTTFFNDFKHQAIEVPCTTLDKFCSDHHISPQVIKIDVELYELKVMQGMKDILTVAKPFLFCEIFNDVVKRKLNPSLDAELEKDYTIKIEEFLTQVGYYFYLLTPVGILYVENLRISPLSSMYLLLPVRLKETFYRLQEAEVVLKELHRD